MGYTLGDWREASDLVHSAQRSLVNHAKSAVSEARKSLQFDAHSVHSVEPIGLNVPTGQLAHGVDGSES